MIRHIEKGSPKAIADLLNRVADDPSLVFRTSLKGETLGVLIESDGIPDLSKYLPALKIVLMLLENSPIRVVKVYGRQKAEKNAAWTKLFYLKPLRTKPLYSDHPSPETAASEHSPQKTDSKGSGKNKKKKSLWETLGFKKRSSHLMLMGIICFLFAFGLDAQLFPLADANRDAAFFTPPAVTVPAEKEPALEPLPPSLPQKADIKPEKIGPAFPFDKRSLTIKAVGDIIPGTDYPRNKLPSNPEILFKSVESGLQDADIVFGNFESTLTTYTRSPKNTASPNVFAFRTPPAYAALLAEAGFSVLNVANNHSMDFSHTGFNDTVRHIETADMLAAGQKGKIAFCRKSGFTAAFISFTTCRWHNSLHNLEEAETLVAEADQEADIIVISIHAGAEGSGALRVSNRTEYFFGENRGNIMQFAHKMVDAGADLILGHGPHVLRGMELYKGKLIAYSLGNFMGYRTLSTAGNLSYSIILEAEIDFNGDFIRGNAIPVILNRQGIPSFDEKHQGGKLLARLTKADFPKTPLAIDKKGRIDAHPSTELALRNRLEELQTVQ